MIAACCMVKYPLRLAGILEYFPAMEKNISYGFMLISFWLNYLWNMKIHPSETCWWKLVFPPFCVFANPFVYFFWIGALSTKDAWRLKLSNIAKWCPKSPESYAVQIVHSNSSSDLYTDSVVVYRFYLFSTAKSFFCIHHTDIFLIWITLITITIVNKNNENSDDTSNNNSGYMFISIRIWYVLYTYIVYKYICIMW